MPLVNYSANVYQYSQYQPRTFHWYASDDNKYWAVDIMILKDGKFLAKGVDGLSSKCRVDY